MNDKEEFVVKTDCKRLDLYLSENSDYSRSHIKRLVDLGRITINGLEVKVSRAVKKGEMILVEKKEAENIDLTPQNIPIDIVFQDDYIAVINKAQGITVHAGGGTKNNTLVNALLFHLTSLSGINGSIRPGIVHRLDKDTSGLMVVAKNDLAHLSLAKQISEKTATRVYWALLEGSVKADKGTISTYIARSKTDRKKMAVSNAGRRAVTHYTVIKRFDRYTLCEFRLETGRTHQIRVHAKHINNPVVGDMLYGYSKQQFNLNGQLLHSKKLSLTHPKTGELISFEIDLPTYFQEILDKLDRF